LIVPSTVQHQVIIPLLSRSLASASCAPTSGSGSPTLGSSSSVRSPLPTILETWGGGGTLSLPVLTRDVIVFCENWPCWVQALMQTRGFKCVKVIYEAFQDIVVWQALYPATAWLSLNQFKLEGADLSSQFVFALSGSTPFVSRVLPLIQPRLIIIVSLHLNQKPEGVMSSHPWSWIEIHHHHHYGGVTTGQFWCGLNLLDLSLPKPICSTRRVRHCAKPLQKGRHHEPPVDPERSFDTVQKIGDSLHPGCFFRLTDPRKKFIVPAVFSPTKWVSSPLAVREVATCCDVQEAILSQFPDQLLDKTSVTSLSFITAPPAKVLGKFFEAVNTVLETNDDTVG
jgi:hypothetical protein